MKKLILAMTILSASHGYAEQTSLNKYCDAVGTVYAGGTPLFNESTGQSISLEDYLAAKGLDLDCNAISAEQEDSNSFEFLIGEYVGFTRRPARNGAEICTVLFGYDSSTGLVTAKASVGYKNDPANYDVADARHSREQVNNAVESGKTSATVEFVPPGYGWNKRRTHKTEMKWNDAGLTEIRVHISNAYYVLPTSWKTVECVQLLRN